MAAGRPFVARRRRRCALGSRCLHGGTIAVGDLAIRPKPHSYVHALDVEVVTKVVADVLAIFQPVVDAWRQGIRNIVDAFAPLARLMASAERALMLPTLELPSIDALAFDVRPNDCWRCDAASDVDALGLCGSCRSDLVAAE